MRLGEWSLATLPLLFAPAIAGVLNLRQAAVDTTDSEAIVTETSSLSIASEASNTITATELTSIPSSTLSLTETPTLSPSAVSSAYPSATPGSAVSNATETSTNTTSALNSTVTTLANPNLNETNDPHACHRTSDTGAEGVTNPFCQPEEGESLNISDYKVIWDASILAIKSNVTVRLRTAESGNSSTEKLEEDKPSLFEQSVASSQGFLFINFTREWLNNQNSTNLTLFLQEDDEGDNKQYAGPTFTLNDDETPDNTKPALGPSTTSSSSGSSSKDLGEKVGAPVGTIAFVAILAIVAFFLWRRYRRRNGASGGGQDYLSGRSHSERTAAPAAGGIPGGRGHRRIESFHDEPTRGMELQERHSRVSSLSQRPGAGDDNWDWGQDTVSSPSSPTSGGRSNVFREELQRQKSVGKGR